MANDDELPRFVRDALARGLPRPQIEQALLQAGWGRDQVKSALAAYADVDFPVPVPRPKAYVSAKDAFLYLVLFTTLYISAYNFGRLIFSFIDRAFPDPAQVEGLVEHSNLAIRWSVSSLIIAFPVFLYVSRLLTGAMRRDPAQRASRVRKWLTYLTLFIAASVLVGDLTTLVYNLLGGELGLRFVLKVITVGVIAAGVDLYWTRRGRLPASLAELTQEQGIGVASLDPETGRPYGYRVLGGNSFELCGEFTRSAAEEGRMPEGDFWTHGAGTQCFRLEASDVKP